MTFARPELLWLLALFPLLLVAAARAAAAAAARAFAFSRPRARQLHAAGARPTDSPAADGAIAANGVLGLYAVAAAMLVLAAAGPQIGVASQEVPAPGVDVVVGLDASRSMWVDDVVPTRLARAQREIDDLADQVTGARFGLVSIGGAGERVAPLSRDRRAFAELVRSVNPTLLRAPGTDLAAGLSRCLSAFDPDSPAARAVVLFSDGGHQGDETSLEKAARAARVAGVTVHAVLVGLPSGGVVPVSGDDRTPLLDPSGTPVRSPGLRAALAVLTEGTGGVLVEIEREPFPAVALAALGFAGAGPSTGTGVIRQVPVDRFRWFVIAAGVLAALGWAFDRRRVRGRGFALPRAQGSERDKAGASFRSSVSAGVPVRSMRALALVGVSLIAAGGPEAPPDRSIEALERAVEARPNDAARRYNLGVARTREGDLDGAEAAFSAAISAAEQHAVPAVAARSRHGRGVVRAVRAERLEGAARVQAWSSAADDFAAAVSIGSDPVDRALLEDAAWNLEWVTSRLLAEQGAASESPRTGAGRDDDGRGPAGDGAEDTGSATSRPGAGTGSTSTGNDGAGEDGQNREDGPAEVGGGALATDPKDTADDVARNGDEAPSPPAVSRGRNVVEIIARFAAERRAYDVRAARASRAEAENDW